MKSLSLAICLFVTVIGFESMACERTLYYVQPVQNVQPVPILQVQVYQAPECVVMVPVVVRPEPVVHQRVIWGYPYHTVTVPVDQYHYWGYDRQCRLINRY